MSSIGTVARGSIYASSDQPKHHTLVCAVRPPLVPAPGPALWPPFGYSPLGARAGAPRASPQFRAEVLTPRMMPASKVALGHWHPRWWIFVSQSRPSSGV